MLKQVVFIDGIGGKRYMRGRLIRFFSNRGYVVHCFDYSASAQTLSDIKRQLTEFLQGIAVNGEYFAIGYSFGGVLLRLVMQECQSTMSFPGRIVLLASPVIAARLSRRLRHWKIYKAMTGECGQVVADVNMMSQIAIPTIPTACIYGIWPWFGVFGLFEGYQLPHDGMIAADELVSPDFKLTVGVKSSHAFIPANQLALMNACAWFELAA